MKYKKPFTLFLCLILLLYLFIAPYFLFSLDRGRLRGEKLEKETSWQGVITIWDLPRSTISGSTFGWIKARITKFEKENPGVFIDLRELNYKNNREIFKKAALAHAENRPDILPLFIGNSTIPLDNIEPLNGWISEESLNLIRKEHRQAIFYEEEMLALPFACSGNVLLLNKDLLQNYNCKVPPNKEWTYGEFIKFIDNIENSIKEEDILTFDAYIGLGEGSVMPILLSDGGQIYQQDQQSFAFYQPQMVSGLQKLLNIKKKARTHEEFGYRNKEDVYKDFLENQKTLILAADSSVIYTIDRLRKKGEGFSYIVMPYPTGSMDIPIWYSNDLSAYAMIKVEDQEKQQIIYKFLEYLIQEESQQSLETLGAFPINNDIKDMYQEEDVIKDLLDMGYEYQTHPYHPNWENIEDEMIKSIRLVLKNEKTPTQAFKELQSVLDQMQ